MAFIPAENTAKIELVYQQENEIVENVFHVLLPTQPTADDLTDICDVFTAWWDVQMQPLVHLGVNLIKILARDLTVEDGVAIEYTTGLPLTGTAGNPLPNNVTLAIKWSTGLAGRSFRGRTYLVGLPDSALDSNVNQITSTYASSLDGAAENLIDLITGDGWSLAVASFFHNNAPRTSAVVTPITAAFVERNVDSQRRRLAGRGT